MSFINHCKAAGASVSPNGITSHSNEPYQVQKVVSVMKVDFCKCVGFPQGIEEIRNEGKRITILLADLVKPTIVNTKS